MGRGAGAKGNVGEGVSCGVKVQAMRANREAQSIRTKEKRRIRGISGCDPSIPSIRLVPSPFCQCFRTSSHSVARFARRNHTLQRIGEATNADPAPANSFIPKFVVVSSGAKIFAVNAVPQEQFSITSATYPTSHALFAHWETQ